MIEIVPTLMLVYGVVSSQQTSRPNWIRLTSQTSSSLSVKSQPDCFYEIERFYPDTKVEKIIREVYRYASLSDGWDGDGSLAPKTEHVLAAENFIKKLPKRYPLPSPMLSYTGVLGFYWDEEQAYADIEFIDKNKVSLYFRSRTDKNIEKYFEQIDLIGSNQALNMNLGEIF
jgi:hypothetical protein